MSISVYSKLLSCYIIVCEAQGFSKWWSKSVIDNGLPRGDQGEISSWLTEYGHRREITSKTKQRLTFNFIKPSSLFI